MDLDRVKYCWGDGIEVEGADGGEKFWVVEGFILGGWVFLKGMIEEKFGLIFNFLYC